MVPHVAGEGGQVSEPTVANLIMELAEARGECDAWIARSTTAEAEAEHQTERAELLLRASGVARDPYHEHGLAPRDYVTLRRIVSAQPKEESRG